ncbi:MAG: FAD:protein FMN transferase [Bacteroidales bacterium]|nr:FAD:protein FMN transferase [Bacteroidales bacterium]
MKIVPRILCLAVLLLLVLSCSRGRYVSVGGYAQGGVYTVKYCTAGVSMGPSAVRDSIDALLREIDFSVSGYNKASILSRYNAGETVTPDRHFAALQSVSRDYHELTGGAFDAASAPLFDIWGFGFTTDSLPSPEAVAAALEECRSGRKLNFNAIAQGYSCDVVAGFLHSIGVKDMLVDIGEIYCEGLNPSGRGWSIGIDAPIDGNMSPGENLSGIWTSDGRPCGVVTSGNYRKFYIKDGRKYSHTIDPRTGYPVTHDLLSATVVAPTATEADALATACMVMGPEEAKAFILARDGVEACLISSGGVWSSPGFTLKK